MFANWMKNNIKLVQGNWFSGIAGFYLNGHVNKRNKCFWGYKNQSFPFINLIIVKW